MGTSLIERPVTGLLVLGADNRKKNTTSTCAGPPTSVLKQMSGSG
jgi:hypothetical protein